MSSINAPFGLRPSYSTSGIMRPEQLTVASGYATNIFQFAPVKIGTNGTLEAIVAPANIATDRIIGVFMGVEFTDNEGRRRYSNRWLANTVATDIVAYTMRDQQPTVYEIQASGPINVADIGSQYNFTTAAVNSGSTLTGLSTATMDVTPVIGPLIGSLRVLGISTAPDNVAGDLFTIVRVQISRHQDVADVAGY